jgi:uncharacterized protein (DUF2252 family)
LHLENFGAYRAEDGELLFDINDFDEALCAPCGYDLVRCTTSAVLAAESWRLSPIEATGIALEFLEQYRAAVITTVRTGRVGEVALKHGHEHGPIRDLLCATALGSQVELLGHQTEKTESGLRLIVRSEEKHPMVRPGRAQKVREAVEQHGKSTANPGAYRVLDVCGRIAGIGSLGLRRYLALVEGDGSPDANWLLDIKEERLSAASAWTGRPAPPRRVNFAKRVVVAQRILQARPIADLAVLRVGKGFYRMRRLIPDEHRSSLDRLQKDPAKLRAAVGVAGKLAAWSQVRGSRRTGGKRMQALFRWAEGPALDAVLASAVRYADRTHRDYQLFHEAYAASRFVAPAE